MYLGRDLLGLFFRNRLFPALSAAFGRWLHERLHHFFAFGLLFAPSAYRAVRVCLRCLHQRLASFSVYDFNSSGPSTILAPRASAMR